MLVWIEDPRTGMHYCDSPTGSYPQLCNHASMPALHLAWQITPIFILHRRRAVASPPLYLTAAPAHYRVH